MMMMSNRAGGGATPGRYPFTATQWQELEHQALIYKCLASGKPIPSYLMPPLRRILDSALATSPSLAFPPQPSLGWGCYGMGFGRKADEDPEPGRCRRTDGKKWRCSKEAYPDSKYCEKHMHRGKNRSRKPVEMSLATPAPPSTAASATTAAASSPAPSYHRPSPAAAAHETSPYTALYGGGGPYATASAARPGAGGGAYHAQASPFHLHLDTTHPHPPASYYVGERDYAYGHAANNKEVGEHAFFSDGAAAAAERDRHAAAGQWQFKQLGGMEQKPSATSLFPDGGGYGNGNTASAYAVDMAHKEDEEEERRRQQQQQQHCFVLGADLRLERPSSHDVVPAAQKPLRPFFDEWPHEKSGKGSWMGLGGETQLSMSIPMAANDLPVTSRYRNMSESDSSS
ncbi:hypothetical protein EJB05_20299 [Eragrostis curvula]|uniref:Growth-regulating factor n=1 Tax=Eragrostis curvula TaxID=38414 RepID=A0A5J9UYQ3_9POAL|nr:hypothetical protein EJB05_20299 [Eragrostis curvula]